MTMSMNPGVPNGNGVGRHDEALPIPRDDPERKLLADVAEYGWHVVAVGGDDEGPPFGYTIGLYHSFGHPEVIIFGLDLRMMFEIITNLGDLIKSGSTFEHLAESSEILEGYLVTFRDVERRHYPDYLGFARWFYQGDRFPAIQCVWPDKQHHYPWHPDFSESLAPAQPVLSDDRSWPFEEGKNRAAFTTRPVIHEGHPILLVSHDEDGDWHFLFGTTDRPEDVLVVSLGEIVDRDPTIGELADLPEGWRATRPDDRAPWLREPIPPDDGE
jgi:hypothetical protein